jgi:signal transduction histidine kinase
MPGFFEMKTPKKTVLHARATGWQQPGKHTNLETNMTCSATGVLLLNRIFPLMLFLAVAAPGFAQNALIDSLKKISVSQQHDTVKLKALFALTNEFLRKDIAQAMRYSRRAIALADTPAEVGWLSGAYNFLIAIYQQTGRTDSARYVLGLSETLCREHPANMRLRINFNQAAGLFYKNQGEFKQALPYLLDNLKIYTKPDESRAGLFLNLGNLYQNLGDFKSAADYHLQGLQLFEKLKNLRGQSFCLQGLGNDFFTLKQWGAAQQYYERSLQIKKQLGDQRGILTATAALGDVSREMGDFTAAERHYQTALAAARGLKLVSEEAQALHQTGLLYSRMQDAAKARTYFLESMALFNTMGDSASATKSKSELMSLELSEQNRRAAERLMINNLNTFIRTGDRQQEALEYLRLSEYHTAARNFEQALHYLKKHQDLTDSIEGNTVLIQLKELEAKYESEKKEQEIQLLKKDQQLKALELKRQRANTTLAAFALVSVVVMGALFINRYRVMNRIQRQLALEKMRQDISRDLHDDLGSTLSSINIMSRMALGDTDNAVTQLRKIATHSAHMMESMSDMVWSINPKNDSTEQVVTKMKEFAAEILDPKDMAYDFEVAPDVFSMKLDVEQRKNIFLIFKEAVNNAAKYSQAKQVQVKLTCTAGAFQLLVRDDGKGFILGGNGSGNGLKNMEARALAMGGKLVVESAPGAGAAIALHLPIAPSMSQRGLR